MYLNTYIFSFGQIQIHSFINVFKYKYFGCISNTNTFQMKKKTNSLFFLCFFILIHTLHNITASTRFVTSILDVIKFYESKSQIFNKKIVGMSGCISWNNE